MHTKKACSILLYTETSMGAPRQTKEEDGTTLTVRFMLLLILLSCRINGVQHDGGQESAIQLAGL